MLDEAGLTFGIASTVNEVPHDAQARADAVKAWLVAKGITGDRITTKGFGPDKPVAPNTTKEGKAKNRRIEFFRVK